MKIESNIEFIKQIKNSSGANLKECMQCGNCTAVCKLNENGGVFPRKEMMLAAWGLKDKLIGNPTLWLCHQCGDCSTMCPRDVKPADVLSSLRQINYLNYSKPKFMAKWLGKPKFLPLVVLIPAIIIFAILLLAGSFNLPKSDVVNYSVFFPHGWLNSSFTLLTLIFYISASFGLRKLWFDMKKTSPGKRVQSIFKSFIEVFQEVGTNKKFRKCSENKSKYIAHSLVFGGFLLLLLVTVVAIVCIIFFDYPLHFLHPAKIAGNIASLMLFIGLFIMIINRLFNKKIIGNSNYTDWYLLITILLLTLSGTLTEAARFMNWSSANYIYFFHLIMVWMVFIYAPFSKFGHMFYRTTALVYVKTIGK